MNLGKPPLPPNRPYCQPLNYHEYVKDFDPYVHVRVFKIAIRVNGETKDVKIVNLFSFTLKDTMSNQCNNHMRYYPNYIFIKLQLAFCKRYKSSEWWASLPTIEEHEGREEWKNGNILWEIIEVGQ